MSPVAYMPLNDSTESLMADLKAANRAMDRIPEGAPVETAEVQASVIPPAGFVPPLDASKDPRWPGPCLRTGADNHVWAESVWTPAEGIAYGQSSDITLHPAHDSAEFMGWVDRLDELLDAAEPEADKCTVPECAEADPHHTAESMHTSAVEWLCADSMEFGPLVSMNYTLEEGSPGFYLELSTEGIEGSMQDLSALADALADVAAQLKARALTSPLSTHRA